MKKPVFEVMNWPIEELLYWQVFYNIDDSGSKPKMKPRKIEQTCEESIAAFKQLFSGSNSGNNR